MTTPSDALAELVEVARKVSITPCCNYSGTLLTRLRDALSRYDAEREAVSDTDTVRAMSRPMPKRKAAEVVINMRATAQQRDMIDWAAEELGMTRTAFMLWAAKQDATRILYERGHFTLVQP